MRPLKITWRLAAPIILGDHPLHLDGLLAFSRVQQALQEGVENPWDAQTDLPLEMCGEVWKSSRLFFSAGQRFRETMIRKWEIQSMARTKGLVWDGALDKPPAGTGRYKGFLLTREGQWSKSAVAWCVGDPDKVEDLLQGVRYLGKMSRIGFGEIDQVQVEDAPSEEAEFWRLRFLPAGQQSDCLSGYDYGKALITVTAPYWDRTRLQEGLVPQDEPVSRLNRCANLK